MQVVRSILYCRVVFSIAPFLKLLLSLRIMFSALTRLVLVILLPTVLALSGCASKPSQKQKIAVLGSGGYTGGLVFGFLQRASSLFGTGVGKIQCLGATAETSRRLNRVLSKDFVLAMADETFVSLTNLQDVDDICKALEGWNALVLGGDLGVCQRPVTANTYERTPNDKTFEIYWGSPSPVPVQDETNLRNQILKNVLQAAARTSIKHVVALDDGAESILPLLQSSEIPYTCVQPRGTLMDFPDFTFAKGVQGELTLGDDSSDNQICRQDLSALLVQCLLSFDWKNSRTLSVAGCGPANLAPVKRTDREWCVHSASLANLLQSVQV